MEDKGTSNSGSEPKKVVALKVPSLFIKSVPSGGGESGSTKQNDESAPKKVSRPMPASARKKLEESKKNEEKTAERTDDSKSEASNGSESSLVKKTSSPRPMPASARKKLEENKSSESAESVNPAINKEVKKPMPASMKRKLEEIANSDNKESSGSDISSASKHSSSSEKKTGKKPMPASARRKLDETKAEEKSVVRDDDNASTTSDKADRVSSIGSTSSSSVKASRPMPASARKKLEMEKETLEINQSLPDENVPKTTSTPKNKSKPGPASAKRKAEESNNHDGSKATLDVSKPNDGEKSETPKASRPMPASARKKLDEASTGSDVVVDASKTAAVDSNDTKKPANKITISLDGIKFPKFSKPMPAFAKRKVEEQQKTTSRKDKDDLNTSEQFQTNINEGQNSDGADEIKESGRTRRSAPLKMLTSLITEKFPCQFCGSEFYSLSSKNKHEKCVHLEKKEKGSDADKAPKKSSSKSSKSKARKGTVYPDSKCPHCAKKISNRKKLRKHVYQCSRPFAFSCQHCDKKFQFKHKLSDHMKTHSTSTLGKSQEVPLSSNENNYGSPVPSPMSASVCSNGGASKSSKESVVEKTKPIPKSVKAKLELKDNQKTSSNNDNDRLNSFKRKIADVLSNLGSRSLSSTSVAKNNESDNEEEDIPSRKKTTLSDGPESIQGRPMPASVRKKLEERNNKESAVSSRTKKSSSETKEKIKSKLEQSISASDADDVDLNECEVCHRMFSQMCNRVRHEKTVHSILEPRTKAEPVSKLNSTGKSIEPSPVPKSRPAPSKKISVAPSTVDLLSIPAHKGKCPICKKIYTRLRRHYKTVHQAEYSIAATAKSPVIPSSSTPVRPSAPKSYKIYKSAANKAKQKLATSSTTAKSTNNAVVCLEKLKPVDSSVQQKPTTRKSGPVTKLEPHREKSVSTDTSKHLDEAVQAPGNFNDHMQIRQPTKKRVINCKICRHMFSHEDDFIIHMQFKHKDLVSEIPDTPIITNIKSLGDGSQTSQQKSNSHTTTTPHSGRITRTSVSASKSSLTVEHQQQSPTKSTRMKENEKTEVESYCKKAHVKISAKDRESAEKANSTPKPKPESSNMAEHLGRNERVTRRTSFRARTPTPEPEVMDTYDEPDHFDDDTMDNDSDPIDDIAITSTFSQRPPSPKKNAPGSDAMLCSTCKEPFYSYEALRKHELYFHNVKTSKNMCPICGVYPTKLSRHLLAHENKTVRCSCAPCRLSFQNFGELLKHNLANHPGPDGGAQCAPNKPRSVPNEPSTSTTTPIIVEPENKSDSISCKICSSSFSTMRQAKQHVWRVHPELTEDVEVYLKQSGESIQKNHDTIITIDSDDDDDDNGSKSVGKPAMPMPASMRAKLQQAKELERKVENKPKPSRPMPASARAKLQNSLETDGALDKNKDANKPKPSRPMPASARARLESQKSLEIEDSNSNDSKAENKGKPSRPMPASARAKLQESWEVDSKKSDKSGVDDMTKQPKRPMPASVRAKLQKLTVKEEVIEVEEKSKPSRPMPASVRAKMNTEKGTQEGSDLDSDSKQETKLTKPMPRAMPASVRAKLMGNDQAQNIEDEVKIIESDDDRDDVPSDGEQAEMQLDDDDDPEYIPEVDPEPLPHSIPTFSMADEIAEHNRAVRIAMGEDLSTFQCKICQKKFDLMESVRRHIRMAHREYGPEQTQSLIEGGYATASLSLRTRKPNVRYTEDDDEDEIIRPPKNRKSNQGMNSSKLDAPDNTVYACKFCGKQWTSSANVKRHIAKSHKNLSPEERSDGLVILGTDSIPYNAESAWNVETPKDDATLFSCSHCSYRSTDEDEYVRHYKTHTGESPFQCPYCSASFPKSQRLDAHVQREHTGAEFLNTEEPEICMEDMVTVAEISVSASSRIQIDQPQAVSLDRRLSSESNGHSTEKQKPGPKSKKSATKVTDPMLTSASVDDEDAGGGSSSPSKEKDEVENSETSKEPAAFAYQADLSSLFPSLREAPSGLDALDDIDMD